MRLRSVACLLAALGIGIAAPSLPAQTPPPEQVVIDARAPATPFPHFWEQMFGSGRAVLALRAGYQKDLREVKRTTGFTYVRFHGIFDRDTGIYTEDAQGRPVYNFTYVDEIYDSLLAAGVKPFVELSFMPKELASREDYHPFWYHPIVSPPASYAKWDDLITAFAKHLVSRYGINEVATWYFEVWNEPNIGFWTGKPAQQTYFTLYDHTARALKAVSPRIRVGGPATAQGAWVDAMIEHATENHVPLDFVSSHAYGNDTAENVFGPSASQMNVPQHGMVCMAVEKVHKEIQASARPSIPLIWSEFNATYFNDPNVTDSIYMGPWLANTIRECDGKVNIMSYWTFSDVFEEQGIPKEPFYGGFGLIATYNIPKPSYDAFELLHGLGHERIANSSGSVLVSKKKNGSLVIAAWNLVEPGVTAPPKSLHFEFRNLPGNATVVLHRIDSKHGDVLAAYKKMGSPQFPSQKQVALLRQASRLGPPQTLHLHNGSLTLTIPPQGLAVFEVRK